MMEFLTMSAPASSTPAPLRVTSAYSTPWITPRAKTRKFWARW